jgi:hypothetical protein
MTNRLATVSFSDPTDFKWAEQLVQSDGSTIYIIDRVGPSTYTAIVEPAPKVYTIIDRLNYLTVKYYMRHTKT